MINEKPLNLIRYKRGKSEKIKQKRGLGLFSCLVIVIMVNLISQLYFLI